MEKFKVGELGNFAYKVLYSLNLYLYYIKTKQYYNTFTVPSEKSKTVSFASSIVKNIVAPSPVSRFSLKLICWIAFGSRSSACYLLKSVPIILYRGGSRNFE